MTSVLGVAQDALVLLTKGWTQPRDEGEANVHARDEKGRPVGPLSDVARSWTFVGALMRATGELSPVPQSKAVYDALAKQVGETPKTWANAPGRTQAEVLAALHAVVRELEVANRG